MCRSLKVVYFERLKSYVDRTDNAKLKRALPHILQVVEEELTEYEPL